MPGADKGEAAVAEVPVESASMGESDDITGEATEACVVFCCLCGSFEPTWGNDITIYNFLALSAISAHMFTDLASERGA